MYLGNVPQFGVHGGFPELVGVHFAEAFVALDGDLFRVAARFGKEAVFFGVVVGVEGFLFVADPVEGGHGEVDVAVFDEVGHVAVEEGEKQGAEVGAGNVRIGHDDELVVADLV